MVALLVALGGTGYAAVVLPPNSVGTTQLKKNAVISAKVKDGSLLKKDFKAGQLPKGDRGPKGDVGARGPSDAYSAYMNGPVALPGSMTTIASLAIPSAGKYVIIGKAFLFDNVNTSVVTDCKLVAGADWDESRAHLSGNSGAGIVSAATVAFDLVHEFSAAGSIDLQCNGYGVSVSAFQIKITAIKVENLTNTAL
jgi:hypothetical protein